MDKFEEIDCIIFIAVDRIHDIVISLNFKVIKQANLITNDFIQEFVFGCHLT